jgi:tRNA (cmo5U34)-methyltransferase
MKSIEKHFNEEANDYDRYFLEELGMKEFYDEIQNQLENCYAKENILVLGCGTGLEIERIKFKSNVTAMDISLEMLKKLEEKNLYKEVNLNLICTSYFDIKFDEEEYDIVLSCYSLHHFSKEQKQIMYEKIYSSLKRGGVFINGDNTTKSTEKEVERLAEAEKIYKENNMSFGCLHLDVPLTIKSEFELLEKARFSKVWIEKEWSNTTLIKAQK